MFLHDLIGVMRKLSLDVSTKIPTLLLIVCAVVLLLEHSDPDQQTPHLESYYY